jgi:hypothetical protein
MTLKGMVRIRTRPTGWRRPRLDQSRGNAPKAIPEMVAKGTIPRTFFDLSSAGYRKLITRGSDLTLSRAISSLL